MNWISALLLAFLAGTLRAQEKDNDDLMELEMEAKIIDGCAPRPPAMQRGQLVGCRPNLHQQFCPDPCTYYDGQSSSSSTCHRRRVHRVPPPPPRRCPKPCSSSSSSSSFWDNGCTRYRQVHPGPRPPPVLGSAENVQVLAFGQPIVSPILLNATWAIIPDLDLGDFDPQLILFNGSNTEPIGIGSVPFQLNLQESLYFSARASFMATPYSALDSAYGIDEDPQYGSGRISLFDPVTGFRFGFILTNNKVYALYQRVSLDITLAFRYLIPIADITNIPSGSSSNYALAVNRALRSITFLIDGATRLAISRPGAPIDQKFLVDGPATVYSQADFPLALQAELALEALSLGRPVCQRALYDQCSKYQSLQNANQMVCTNGPLQVNPFLVLTELEILDTAVYRVNHVFPPCPGECRAAQQTCCQQACRPYKI